ncbi:DUF3017 domain-containing protein [Streptomyces sp. NPDC008313]|uniref:DUF3017 domain-containing protein n=1 Tax=Streptomyces sp. NPDC008313 TaxID=3364826 RepID=UPI0036EF7346
MPAEKRPEGTGARKTEDARSTDTPAAPAADDRETPETTPAADDRGTPEAAPAADDREDPETPADPDGRETAAEPTVRDAVSAPDAEGRPRRVTRRFPLFTRDTARPEGGGRAAPRDAPAPARQWPILAVLSGVGLGLLLTALDVFRVGTMLVGVALLAGGVLRWAVPDVGMLAVRSRFTDIVTYGVLGTAIVLLAAMAQPEPWLVIPFLDDTLHFTVS